MACKWRSESIEEMELAAALIARIVFPESAPTLQELDPLRTGETLHEALDADLTVERRALHREARDVAEEARDFDTKGIFEMLMADEEIHIGIDFLETEIDLLVRIGEASSGDLNARPADGASRGPRVQDQDSAGRAGGS